MTFVSTLTKDSAPEEVREEWVRALESGEYQQCRMALHVNGGFCCLGVLTDLAVQAGLGSWKDFGHYPGVAFFSENGTRELTFLGQTVMQWAGIKQLHGGLTCEVMGENTLSALNDLTELSFGDIAKVIRWGLVMTQ